MLSSKVLIPKSFWIKLPSHVGLHAQKDRGWRVGEDWWGRELWTRSYGSTLMNQRTTTPAKGLTLQICTCIPVAFRLTDLFAWQSHTGTANPPVSLIHVSKDVSLLSKIRMVFLINWWHCILRRVSHSTQGKPRNSSQRNAPEIKRNYSLPLSLNTKPNIIKLSSYIKMLQRKQPT